MTGSFFAGNPGRPTAEFLAQNAFLRLVTVDRPAISYFVNLPAVMPTLAVVLLAGGAFTVAGAWRRRRVFVSGGAWILFVVLVYVALGLVGYSKLLRYAILAVPPAVVLFADLFGALVDDPLPIGTGMRRLLVALATAALLAECAIGLKVVLVDWDLAFIPAIL